MQLVLSRMYTAVSGQLALSKQIDVVANNLANLNTAGFKAEHLQFEKALRNEGALQETSLKKDVQEGSNLKTQDFVSVKGSYSDLSQGPVESTNNPLDVSIDGKGFFVVSTPDGERYTRAGNFRRDDTNRLVNQEGYAVQGQGGDIIVNAQSGITVAKDGSVLAGKQNFGKLRSVDIPADQLVHVQGTLLKWPMAAAVLPKLPTRLTRAAL